MKSINLCLLFLTLFTIMSCTTPNTDIEIQTSPIQLDVENYGNYHNEAVLSVIQSESSKNSFFIHAFTFLAISSSLSGLFSLTINV